MKKALLLIDIQNDYFPGGAKELVGSIEAGRKAGELLKLFRQNSLPVIHIQHISEREGATFFLPDTHGVEIHDSVFPDENEVVFRKHYPNAFRETGLLQYLRDLQISQLVIAGMMTHLCIDTSVRAAFDLGFKCSLAHDACATKGLTFGDAKVSAKNVQTTFLAALNGIFADVRSSEELYQMIL